MISVLNLLYVLILFCFYLIDSYMCSDFMKIVLLILNMELYLILVGAVGTI